MENIFFLKEIEFLILFNKQSRNVFCLNLSKLIYLNKSPFLVIYHFVWIFWSKIVPYFYFFTRFEVSLRKLVGKLTKHFWYILLVVHINCNWQSFATIKYGSVTLWTIYNTENYRFGITTVFYEYHSQSIKWSETRKILPFARFYFYDYLNYIKSF